MNHINFYKTREPAMIRLKSLFEKFLKPKSKSFLSDKQTPFICQICYRYFKYITLEDIKREPKAFEFYRYQPEGFYQPIFLARCKSCLKVYEIREKMENFYG